MSGYAVTVTVLLPEPVDLPSLLPRFPDSVGVALSGGQDRLTAIMSIEAKDPVRAAAVGGRTVLTMLPDARDIVEVEVLTHAEQDRRNAQPLHPDLAGVTEVAALLGVTRQRLAELRKRPGFPLPVAELAAGPIWHADSLRHFLESWDRKPGRPSKTPLDQSPRDYALAT